MSGDTAADAELTARLLACETALLQQAVRADPAQLAALIADDFFEFGVSGTVWTKPAVIAALQGEHFSPRRIHDFRAHRLAVDVALVTYRGQRLATPQRPAAASLRSSIWKRRDGDWQMVFHQGTPL